MTIWPLGEVMGRLAPQPLAVFRLWSQSSMALPLGKVVSMRYGVLAGLPPQSVQVAALCSMGSGVPDGFDGSAPKKFRW